MTRTVLIALGAATVTGVVGFVIGRQRAAARERELQSKLDAETQSQTRALSPGRPPSIPSIIEPGTEPLEALAPYREPVQTAVLLPSDADDYAQLHEALCVCLAQLRQATAAGTDPTTQELRKCLLDTVYPDFPWPPVPRDDSSARYLWLIAGHEAAKVLATDGCLPTEGFVPGPLPPNLGAAGPGSGGGLGQVAASGPGIQPTVKA